MKIMKKLATILLAVCLVVPCFSMVSQAANGEIMFSDPSTKVGETVEITCAVKASTELGDVDIQLSYDAEYLRFESGDNVTKSSDGSLAYSTSGDGKQKEIRSKIKFIALKEGTSSLKINSYKVWKHSVDEKIECKQGSSKIQIAEGNPANIPTEEPTTTVDPIEVEGKVYQLSQEFDEAAIPAGFVSGTLDYNGVQYKAAVQESEGITLAYLVDDKKVGKFFLYDSASSKFEPFEQIHISDLVSIMLLKDVGDLKLPKEYQSTEISLNGHTYPAWCNTEKPDHYVFYALNSHGEKAFYQYDSVDATYQKFEIPKAKAPTSDKKEEVVKEKAMTFVEEYATYIILALAVLSIVLLVFLIVVSVKLRNRNEELDALYDEYGIDLEEEDDLKIVDAKEHLDLEEAKVPTDSLKEEEFSEEHMDLDDFDDLDDLDHLDDLDDFDDDLFDDDFDDDLDDSEKNKKGSDEFNLDFIDFED